MVITIEVLVILAIIIFTILGIGLIYLTKLIKLWRYKPENDKGKLAEESRLRQLAEGEGRSSTEPRNIPRVVQPQRRSVFSIARPVNKTESSGTVGKNRRSFRNPFKPRARN